MVEMEFINEQNPWWKKREVIKEDKKIKEVYSKKNKLIFNFQEEKNMLFVGPRQVGKTTFFKLLIYDLLINKEIDPKSIFYLSCDVIKDYKELLEVFRKFETLYEGKKYIFLDEISFVEEWERGIKYILDSPLSKNKIIYLTGSSSLRLKKEGFPGRDIEIRNFLPLTFREFCKIFGSKELKDEIKKVKVEFKSMKEVFEKCKKLIYFQDELERMLFKYMSCGGFPKSFFELMEEGEIKNETYDIYWNWIIHDILKSGRSERIANGVLGGVIKNYGTKFSLSSIAKEVEIASHVTVREYLEILECLFSVLNFSTFDINKKKIVFRKMRKAYFYDPFFYHVFSKKIFGKEKENLDKIIESIVATTITRKIQNIGFFHNRKEIDVAFGDFGIEVKWQKKVKPSDFPKIEVKNKILVTKEELRLASEVVLVPGCIFLCLI